MRILLAKVVVAVPNGFLTSIGGREAQTFGKQVLNKFACQPGTAGT